MSSKGNSTNFRAARLSSFGSPLRVESVGLSPLGPRDVSIKVHFAGINFYELMIMDGKYPSLPTLPTTPGGELAGVVLETGSDVKTFHKGDRVFSLAQTGKGTTGSYGEIAQVNEQYLYALPKAVSFKTGASIPMVTFAAYAMLRKRVTIPENGVVLIHSAAGGVGSALIQLADAMFPKLTIIGTCSNDQKAETVHSLGADVVINTKKRSFVNEIHKNFPNGIDVIFDPVGQQYIDAHLSLLRPLYGTICSYGTYTGPITDSALVTKLRKGNLTFSGFLMWPLLEHKESCMDIFTNVFELLSTKQFKPLIDKVFPLEKVNDGIARIRQRKNIGKVLIKP